MNNIILSLMTGIDILVPECNLVVHQPTMKEIAFLGEEKFFLGTQILTISKGMITQDENVLTNTDNFHIFMMIMTEKETEDKKQAALELLEILFPDYKIKVLPRSLFFSKDEANIIIDERNFESLQQILKQIFCINSNSISQGNFNPANAAAEEIAKKLMKARQRVAKQQSASENGSSVFTTRISSLVIGSNSMTLKDCLNLTMFQLLDLEERFSLKQSNDLYFSVKIAGGKMDREPENWTKNIH